MHLTTAYLGLGVFIASIGLASAPSVLVLSALPRWSCSRQLFKYVFVRCRMPSPSSVRIARGYASLPSVVTRSGVAPVTTLADRKKALAAPRSRCFWASRRPGHHHDRSRGRDISNGRAPGYMSSRH